MDTSSEHTSSSSSIASGKPKTPVIQQQQDVVRGTSIPIAVAQPTTKAKVVSKKTVTKPVATSSVAAPTKKEKPLATSQTKEIEDEKEEMIIPHKVPMSESDDDDDGGEDEPEVKVSASPVMNKPLGAHDKTFLSEEDLAGLKPASFVQQVQHDSAASLSHQASREAEEKALAAAEASLSYRPRVEWSTSDSSESASSSSFSSFSSSTPATTEVFCMTWSPDSRFLAIGCGDGSIRIFNAASGKVVYVLRSNGGGGGGGNSSAASSSDSSLNVDNDNLPITCLRYRPESESKTKHVLLSTSADGTITHWHVLSQTCLYSIQEQQDTSDAQIYTCDYKPDATQFVTGGRDGKLRIYDEATKSLTQILSAGKDKGTTGHSNRIYTVKWNKLDENILFSGGWDNTIQIWDLKEGHSVRSIYGPHLCGDALDISPDNRTFLTASWRPNETLQRWDLQRGELLSTIPFSAGPGGLGADRPELLYACAYSPDGTLIAAGGCGTNETKLFTNTDKPKVVERISMGTGGVYCLAFAPSGKKLAIGGGGTHVTVIDV